jgi:hypothetical protein
MTIAFTVTALLLGIIGAVAAGTGTVAPPPKIAFVTTNANVAPDALTVGPMAGRLGAPLFITDKDNLGEDTKNALVAYDPQLIIIAGGPNTVTDAVLAQIAAATGLDIKEFDDKPSSGIIRAFGSGRDQTAAKLSELIANYNPKFLPTDATAADSDLLDGKDSTAFLGKTEKAADADKLDGLDSSAFSRKTIPSGTTVYGVVGGQYNATAGGQEFGQSASLPAVAPVGLVDNHVNVKGGFDDDPTNCTGTALDPTAAPGYVCIYPYYSTNAETINGAVWGGSGEPNPWGFTFGFFSSGAGASAVFATWAYTAP